MNKDKAQQRLAILLALNTADHRESAHKNRNLIDNARAAENLNIDIAKFYGVQDMYQYKVNMFAPRLFYTLD